MKKILKFLRAIWELPQNLVGYITKLIFKAKYIEDYKTAKVYLWGVRSACMSLGKYIFVSYELAYVPEDYAKELVMHEYGHTIQSKYLGWLYLLVIALPSLIWAWCFEGWRKKHNKPYSWLYTESWADRLGGVTEVQAEK